ncbi:hypothetical protein B0H17DRAFT_949358, partial [Mycena rosella]
APLFRRQTGDLQCNLARLRIISDVAGAQTLIGQLNTTDLTTASLAAVAQASLKSANDGIQDVLTAVLNGQIAPANARDQVGVGIAEAILAVGNITE